MNSALTLKIKKRSQQHTCIYFIVFFPFFNGLIFELLHLPWAIKYTLDVAWIFLTALIILNFSRNNLFIPKWHKFVYFIPIIFFLFVCFVYIFRYESLFYFLWGFRNNFRFYLTFFAFCIFLTKDDIDEIFSILDKVFWYNSLIVLIQYFLLGKRHDYLGGFFGVEKGCNSYLYIFLVIMTVKSIIYYLNAKSDIWNLIAVCGTSLLISAFAELKFFYLQFILVVFLAVIITDFSWRKLLLVIAGMVCVFIALQVLISIYPYFAKLFSFDAFLESVITGGYSADNQVNRLTTIPVISERFFETEADNLFGLGLGNCDTSNIDILNTPFFQEYSYLKYNWFSTAMLYLETGIVGMLIYFLFFIAIFIYCIRKRKATAENKVYYNFTAIMATCAILTTIYNNSLRTEAGYLIYFSLCIPFVLENHLSNHILVDT